MAGYGNYRGNSAIAMGVAHYKNESTLMHAGVSWAGGSRHMMANAGVTWKVGNRDSEAAVAIVTAKALSALLMQCNKKWRPLKHKTLD